MTKLLFATSLFSITTWVACAPLDEGEQLLLSDPSGPHQIALDEGVADAGCTADTWDSFATSFFSIRCNDCHGHHFDRTTDEREMSRVRSKIASGSMPKHETLAPEEKARILQWIDCGTP